MRPWAYAFAALVLVSPAWALEVVEREGRVGITLELSPGHKVTVFDGGRRDYSIEVWPGETLHGDERGRTWIELDDPAPP